MTPAAQAMSSMHVTFSTNSTDGADDDRYILDKRVHSGDGREKCKHFRYAERRSPQVSTARSQYFCATARMAGDSLWPTLRAAQACPPAPRRRGDRGTR